MINEFSQPNSGLVMVPLDFAVAQTVQQISRTDVPEMPDRIIAATAYYLGLPLVTRDHKIRSANLATIW
jgi:predicted nucleic acid-binding protein